MARSADECGLADKLKEDGEKDETGTTMLLLLQRFDSIEKGKNRVVHCTTRTQKELNVGKVY